VNPQTMRCSVTFGNARIKARDVTSSWVDSQVHSTGIWFIMPYVKAHVGIQAPLQCMSCHATRLGMVKAGQDRVKTMQDSKRIRDAVSCGLWTRFNAETGQAANQDLCVPAHLQLPLGAHAFGESPLKIALTKTSMLEAYVQSNMDTLCAMSGSTRGSIC
jgi:hypothetical protein